MAKTSDDQHGGARPKSGRIQIGTVQGSSGVTAGVIHGDVHQHVSTFTGGKKDAEEESELYLKVCKLSERHVRTTLYYQLLDMLESKNSVTVVGNGGDGKTTLLHLVCLEYSSRGYQTIQIDRPEDIDKYRVNFIPVLFVCDNFLGRILIDHDKTKSWINFSGDKLTFDNVKVLFACRIELWREFEAHLHQNPLFKDKVDVRSYKLTEEDKMEMINQHLGENLSERTMYLIVQNANFAFAECCRFVSNGLDVIDFTDTRKLIETFSNPYQFVLKQLETLEKNNKTRYATLVICLLNERKLPKTGTYDILTQPNFEKVRKMYLSDKSLSVEQLYDIFWGTAKQLDGWLLAQQGNNYVFYHDSIYEAMCRVHGARYPEQILTFCEPGVVFSLFTTKQVSGSDSDRLTVTPGCYPQLAEIVTKECLKGWGWWNSDTWNFVFEEMRNPDILKEWSKILKRKRLSIKKISQRLFSRKQTEPTLADVLLLMTKLSGSPLTLDRLFGCAVEHGDVETSKLLIDSGVTTHGREEGLKWAACRGQSDVVRMIVERRDLDISVIEEVLRGAVSSDRVECVREVMRLPDIDRDTIYRVSLRAVDFESVNSLCELLKRDMGPDSMQGLLKYAVRYDRVNSLFELMKRDVDTDTLHEVLKSAVRFGSVRSVTDLVKRPDVNKQTIHDMLGSSESDLFRSDTSQTKRDETLTVLLIYLDNDI